MNVNVPTEAFEVGRCRRRALGAVRALRLTALSNIGESSNRIGDEIVQSTTILFLLTPEQ